MTSVAEEKQDQTSQRPRKLDKRWDARPGSSWRSVVFVIPVAIYAFAYAFYGYLYATFLPKRFDRRRSKIISGWGKLALFLYGVKVELHGKEYLNAPHPKIIIFNHVSLFDLWIVTKIWPYRATVLYKEEFHKYPILGRALRRGVQGIPVNRSDREAARHSIREAATHIRKENWSIMIAPEGTRSREGGLQKFKTGPFHLAAETHVPLVPMVMQGISQIMPMGSWRVRSGTVRIDVLPPIDTIDWTHESVREHASAVRQLFLDYLEPAPGT